MNGGNSSKRKRLEQTVESHIILDQSSSYHLPENDNREEWSKRVCVAAQQLSDPDQGVLEVRQQLTVDACIESVPPLQTAHPALFDTTTELSKPSCKHERSESIIAKQVCFDMICILNSCHLVPLILISSPLAHSTCIAWQHFRSLFPIQRDRCECFIHSSYFQFRQADAATSDKRESCNWKTWASLLKDFSSIARWKWHEVASLRDSHTLSKAA